MLRPVDQPRSKRLNRAGVRLMHQRNMSIAACTGLLELLLTLLGGLAVPIARVNVVSDDLVSERLHSGQHVSTRGKVWRTHVRGLLADDVHHGLLEALHLLREVIGAQTAKVRGVSPGVAGDLMA